MDRFFRKRTISTKEAHGIPIRSNSFGSDSSRPEKATTLRKKSNGKGRDRGDEQPRRVESPVVIEAPRVELNIRNSLMLPGLSQRFSVLLPSLSSIPANSLRDELANQRQRGGGPAITEEEEELLFAELQDIEAYKKNYQLSPLNPQEEWDGRPSLPTANSSNSLASTESGSRGYMNAYYTSDSLSGSSSTPNLMAAASSPDATSPMSSSPPIISPPPTSTSFDSFATFGVGGSSSSSPVDERNAVRTKSYGFSGGSSMRDHDYIRRVKKSASTRNFSGSTSTSSRSYSIRSDDSEETAAGQGVPTLPPISVDKANMNWAKGKNGMGSPTGSDRTATPTSGYTSPLVSSGLGKRQHSPSSSVSLSLPPPQPAPTGPLPPASPGESGGNAQRQRKSMLQGLTPAQMRRISAALVEIGHGRGLEERGVGGGGKKAERAEDEEEQLEEEPQTAARLSEERTRYESNAKSDNSEHSTGSSSLFPYYTSPTTSSFAAAVQPPSEPSSPPARVIPASPKSHDLRAKINRPPSPSSTSSSSQLPTSPPSQSRIITEAARPVPVLTPTKSLPVRHNSSLSTDSSSPIASSIPRYIPGQPRPVGSGSVRSDGSDSSRSATPTNPYAHRAGSSTLAPSPNGYRNRSDSNPSPIHHPPSIASRTTSLARSQSVQQSSSPNGALSPPLSTQSHSSAGSAESHFGRRGIPASLSQPAWGARRPNSPFVIEAEAKNAIPEADEAYGEVAAEGDGDEQVRVYDVPSRRSVARSRSDSISPVPLLPHSDPIRPEFARAPSQQGYISSYLEGSTDSHHYPTTVSTTSEPLKRVVSLESIGSSFHGSVGHSGEDGWSPVAEVMLTLESAQIGELRDLCGMEREELSEMQIRLVDRAKAEREALLGGMAERSFSPVCPGAGQADVQVPQVTAARSFPLDLRPTSPDPPPATFRALSPPPAQTYRATTPDILENRHIPSSPVQLGNVFTPPPAAARAAPIIADHRPPPAPPAAAPAPSPPIHTPSEAHDEISTPTSEHLSRAASQRKASASTPGDDPEKIRDFEARIAAATAALNRTPTTGSSSGPKLERKNTKRGAMVISTPRLLSSSANLSAKRLDPQSPDMAVDSHTAKALENASGSSKKMSLRWRKLGFGKKGPSISSTEIYSPPLPSSASSSPNPNILEEPIALSPIAHPPAPVPVPEPTADLRGFKFPPNSAAARPSISSTGSTGSRGLASPPGTANPSSGIRQIMGKFKKGKSDEAEFFPAATEHRPSQPEPVVVEATSDPVRRIPSGSEDPAVAKFIAAGRAVGLNDAQLHEMLLANGMLKQPAALTSIGVMNGVSAAPLHSTAAEPVPAQKEPEAETKEKGGGIFRSLSRKKSKRGLTGTERPAVSEATEARNKLVRRTLLLPENYPVTPQPNRSPALHTSPEVNLNSPTNISFGRKPSTRRKPIPLTQEDELLVADAGSTRGRNTSLTSTNTGISVGERMVDQEGQTAGLGFLHPTLGQGDVRNALDRESSGSLYDLYGNGDEGQGDAGKGIEIMEYEDGRVVWGVIDALRDDEASESDYTQAGGHHSRQTSYASSHLASEASEVAAANGWKKQVAPLQLRHRERGGVPAALRPETNLYFTSPTDIGDLIDQLSRDPSGNKGRIDFSSLSPDFEPSSGPSSQPPPQPQQISTPPSRSAPGQFEDAPSPPRKTPPAPIIISRTNNIPAGGFSPKRQKHVRQGGFGRPGGGSLGGGLGPATASPSAASFASSQSGGPSSAKPVEDRLQALMDRLVSSGATRKV